MNDWFKKNLVVCTFISWLFGSFMIAGCFQNTGAIFVILFFSYFGVPPLIGTLRGFSHILGEEFLLLPQKIKWRVMLLALLLIVLSLGMVAFVVSIFAELFNQITCSGVGCAQGEVSSLMLIPIAWVSYGLVWFANECLMKYKLWPAKIEPNFSYNFYNSTKSIESKKSHLDGHGPTPLY